MDSSSIKGPESDASELEQRVFRELARTLRSMRFGSVLLTVHEGRVVEIHRTEKIRMTGLGSKDP